MRKEGSGNSEPTLHPFAAAAMINGFEKKSELKINSSELPKYHY